MHRYQFNRRPVIGTTVAQSHLFLNYVFSSWYLVTTARQRSSYKSPVCLNDRSLNTRLYIAYFYEPRDPTSMQFKQQSNDLIFIITIRGTADIIAMVVTVI